MFIPGALRTASLCSISQFLVAVAITYAGTAYAQTPVQIDAPATQHILTPAHPDVYTANLTAGDYYLVTAFQESVDLVLDVYGPDGNLISSVDSPNGSFGPEEWDRVAPATGTYRFVIRELDKKAAAGRYTMAVRTAPGYIRAWINEQVLSPRIRRLWLDLMSDPSAVDQFLAERNGKGPLVEPKSGKARLVTFVFKAAPSVQMVWLDGGPSPDGRLPMQTVGDSDLWFVTSEVPNTSRFSYSFEVQDRMKAGATSIPTKETLNDPLNPAHTVAGPSMLILDDAPKQPFSGTPAAGAPHGKLAALALTSLILKEKRTYSVYTPPGFDPSKRNGYGVLFLFDGENYGSVPPPRRFIATPDIMDNAIDAGKLPPMVVVLIDNMHKRARDLTCSRPFADFVALELLPEVRRRYPAITNRQSRVIVGGASFGGLCAAYCGLTHSRSFGNVLSQSGSYWVAGPDYGNVPYGIQRDGYIPAQFVRAKHLPLRFFMEVGTYESAAAQLMTNRQLRDVLRAKGYDVTYREFAGNHDYEHWRGSFVDGLACLTRDWKYPPGGWR